MKRKIIVLLCIILLIVSGILVWYFSNHDKTLADTNSIKTDPKYENIVYEEVEDIWDESVLGILTIDAINLKATVKDGTDNDTLSKCIGHIEQTAMYDGNVRISCSQQRR